MLTVVSPLDISGRVEFEDAQTKQKLSQPQLLLNQLGGDGGDAMAQIMDDGSLQLQKLAPGRYRVSVGQGAYVKSMRLGQTEIDGSVLDLRHPPAGAELLLMVSSTMGGLSGTVRDEKGTAAKAWVALVPADEEPPDDSAGGGAFSFAFEISRSKDDGTYSFDGIAPAKYKLIAIEKNTDIEVSDYDDVAEEMEIRAGEKISKDLTRQRN